MTVDGLVFVGNFLGTDRSTNITLSNAEQRAITSPDDPEDSQIEPTGGIQFVRGDMVVMIGLIDEEIDDKVDWRKVKGEEIGSTKVPSG